MKNFVHESSIVDGNVSIGSGVQIWAHSHIRERCKIETNVSIGEYVYIGPGITINENCKIQNQVLIYEPAEIGKSVFIGPGVTLTNDKVPRAINSHGEQKGPDEWVKDAVILNDGCSIGANSVCVAPVKIGKYAMVAAGSVVTKNVPDYALVAGNPAKQIGWIDESGQRLRESGQATFVSEAGNYYQLALSGLKNISK